MSDKAKKVLERFGELRADRGSYERWWQDIRDLVRPNTTDFQRHQTKGDVRSDRIYDGTAPQALEELASGLQSFLTPPSQPWFDLTWMGDNDISNDLDARGWLQEVRNIIFQEYSLQPVNLNPTLTEAYLDLGAFGTAVVSQDSVPGGSMVFKAIPLADCYMDENEDGRIDTIYRKLEMTIRQLVGQFGEEAIPKQMLEKHGVSSTRKFEVVHAVYPRTDRDIFGLAATDMPYASLWVLKQGDTLAEAIVLKESGYKTNPFHVPRWTKIAMETYGRGPAMQCLPDIRMLNRMEYTNIKAASKMVDPSLILPHDGFIMPIKTGPGSLNFKEDRDSVIDKLPGPEGIPIVLEYTEQKRDFIRQCFFADWLRMEKEKIEMTAFEVQDRRDEKLRFLAPMLGRIMVELLSPLIERSYDILADAGRIPDAPPALLGNGTIRVAYSSPAAQAQKSSKAVSIGRFIQELAPAAQVDPSVYDRVDFDRAVDELADARAVPVAILRTDAELAQMREARERQEQAAAVAGAAEPVSKAVKNLAEANEAGNIL